MRSDDDFKMPEGDFIPGIYNYCDSWCERCFYTDRCMNFAMGESIEKEIESHDRLERSMKENRSFWEQIDKTMEEAADLIDEEYQIKKEWQDSEFDFDDEDTDEAMHEYEAIRKKAEGHELSVVSIKYSRVVHDWFKKARKPLNLSFDEETGKLTCNYTGLDKEGLKQLTEAIELIRWYEMMISVKIRRALSSMLEEETDRDFYEDFPKDSDGSAMVALKGINASIGGWTFVYKVMPSEAAMIKSFLHMLWWLKKGLENKFPGALTFEWPPKEEE